MPQRIELVCDFPSAVKKIKAGRIDRHANVIDCLNILFDIIEAVGIERPPIHKEKLFLFHQHLSADKDIAKFFNEYKKAS